MDLLGNLNSSQWQSAEPNTVNDLKVYVIVRAKMLKPGSFEFAIREDSEDANSFVVLLDGAAGKTNPLQSVRNAEMRIQDGKITAINLDGDCVARK